MPPRLALFLIRAGFPATVKQVLSIACFESRNLGHNFIGSEHVLCALVRLPDSRLQQIFGQRGAAIEIVRSGVVDVDTLAACRT
jgi:ATP-dependent Clp protease ATP-binding subunit ClpA